MSTAKEVATQSNKLPAVSSMDEWQGLGAEDASADDFVMPFLTIAQALSPQIDKSEPSYIEGLEKGMIFNSATGEIYGDSITVIPTKFERRFLEFKLRENGGGLVEIHDHYDEATLCVRDSINRSINDAGNQIVDTRSFYCLVKGAEGDWSPAIISMKGTQGKKARQWMTLMSKVKWEASDGRRFSAPLFANTYTLSTIQEKNDKGSWYGWMVAKGESMMPDDGDERFEAAHAFYKQLVSGGVKVDYAASETGAGKEEELETL